MLKRYKFVDLYDMSSGISTKPAQAGHGSPFVSFRTVFNNHFLPDVLPDLMDTSLEEQETYSIKKGDVLLTRTSETIDELGMSCVALKDYPGATYSGFTKRLRPRHRGVVDERFIGFYLRSGLFRKTMTNNAVLTLRASLNEEIFSYLDLLLPDFETQQRIGEVLFNLNQKIALNQRINAELEAMAKLLYDYWFVQFDFPMSAAQAKRLGKAQLEGRPYKSSGGPMVYNPELKREVPEGWGAGVLSDIAKITMGQSPPGSSYNETGEGSIFFQGSTDFGIRFPLTRMYTTQPTRRAKADDILLSVRAPVGTMNVAFQDCAIGRGLAALNSKHGAISYLCEVMKYFEQVFQRRDKAGTTFGSIGKDDLFGLKVVLADKEVVQEFEKIARPMFDEQRNIEAQNRELAGLRDWLLPLLMNGQVRVSASLDVTPAG